MPKRVVRGSRAVTRPEFDVTERNLDRLTTQAWELIDKSNEPPVIFRFGGHPHRVELDDKDQPSPKQLTRDLLRHHLAAWAYWFRRTTESDIATPPPMDLVDNILATPDMRLPILERITQALFSRLPESYRRSRAITRPAERSICRQPVFRFRPFLRHRPRRRFNAPAI